MKKILFILISNLILFTSCEEDINMNVAKGESKIVIEGSIENDSTPEVIITRNSALSDAVDFRKILVTDAKVYVSDGITTDTLHFGIDSFASIPLLYKATHIRGQIGRTYNLTVIADGKTFNATTTIPSPVPLDSVYFKPQPPSDTLGFAWARFKEPAGLGNAYRWFAKRPTRYYQSNGAPSILNRRYVAPGGGSFDDKFVDGKEFEFAYDRSYDPTETAYYKDEPRKERGYYNIKDTIYIKFCSIDYQTYKFFSTYDQALQSNGNPFSSPTSILSNISNGGLGIWAGYGASYYTILPPH